MKEHKQIHIIRPVVCPYCGAELTINPHPFDGCIKARCVNADCRYAEWTFPLEIWQALIAGKAAQEALDYVLPNLDSYMYMYLITRTNLREFCIVKEQIETIKQKITSITKQEN